MQFLRVIASKTDDLSSGWQAFVPVAELKIVSPHAVDTENYPLVGVAGDLVCRIDRQASEDFLAYCCGYSTEEATRVIDDLIAKAKEKADGQTAE